MNSLENQVTANQEDTSQYDKPLIMVNKDTALILIPKDIPIYNECISNMHSCIYYSDNIINAKTTLVMQLMEKFLGNMKSTLGTSDRKMK